MFYLLSLLLLITLILQYLLFKKSKKSKVIILPIIGSTSSFWTHSALVFSWATSRKDCSTSQVARQSEKSL